MEIEHKTVMLTVDETLQPELDKFVAEGWQAMFKPVAIYQLTRIAAKVGDPIAHMGAGLKVTIDESKIGILRNGKLLEN